MASSCSPAGWEWMSIRENTYIQMYKVRASSSWAQTLSLPSSCPWTQSLQLLAPGHTSSQGYSPTLIWTITPSHNHTAGQDFPDPKSWLPVLTHSEKHRYSHSWSRPWEIHSPPCSQATLPIPHLIQLDPQQQSHTHSHTHPHATRFYHRPVVWPQLLHSHPGTHKMHPERVRQRSQPRYWTANHFHMSGYFYPLNPLISTFAPPLWFLP